MSSKFRKEGRQGERNGERRKREKRKKKEGNTANRTCVLYHMMELGFDPDSDAGTISFCLTLLICKIGTTPLTV